MKSLKTITSFLFLLILSSSIYAQKNFAKDADLAFRNEAYTDAKDLYKKAYPKVPKAADKARIIFQIGECYRNLNDDPNAEASYLEAIELGYADQNTDVIARLADVQKEQGKYDDAIKNYNGYMDAGGDPTVTRTGVKSCRLAIVRGDEVVVVEHTLQVKVFDKTNKKPLANAKIKVVGTDNSSYEVTTDANGGFNFELNGEDRYIKADVKYGIQVDKTDYLVAKDQVSTLKLRESTIFVKEFYIQYASADVPIRVPNVNYKDSQLQLEDGKTGLDNLYKTLIENPTISIELQAHTDHRGSATYNRKISQNRAQTCIDYLVRKGISKERLTAVGFGGSKPLSGFSDDDISEIPTKKGREMAHQKNRRTEFTVLNFDYTPQ